MGNINCVDVPAAEFKNENSFQGVNWVSNARAIPQKPEFHGSSRIVELKKGEHSYGELVLDAGILQWFFGEIPTVFDFATLEFIEVDDVLLGRAISSIIDALKFVERNHNRIEPPMGVPSFVVSLAPIARVYPLCNPDMDKDALDNYVNMNPHSSFEDRIAFVKSCRLYPSNNKNEEAISDMATKILLSFNVRTSVRVNAFDMFSSQPLDLNVRGLTSPISAPALAETDRSFVFQRLSHFDGLKGLAPVDSLNQKVTVTNDILSNIIGGGFSSCYKLISYLTDLLNEGYGSRPENKKQIKAEALEALRVRRENISDEVNGEIDRQIASYTETLERNKATIIDMIEKCVNSTVRKEIHHVKTEKELNDCITNAYGFDSFDSDTYITNYAAGYRKQYIEDFLNSELAKNSSIKLYERHPIEVDGKRVFLILSKGVKDSDVQKATKEYKKVHAKNVVQPESPIDGVIINDPARPFFAKETGFVLDENNKVCVERTSALLKAIERGEPSKLMNRDFELCAWADRDNIEKNGDALVEPSSDALNFFESDLYSIHNEYRAVIYNMNFMNTLEESRPSKIISARQDLDAEIEKLQTEYESAPSDSYFYIDGDCTIGSEISDFHKACLLVCGNEELLKQICVFYGIRVVDTFSSVGCESVYETVYRMFSRLDNNNVARLLLQSIDKIPVSSVNALCLLVSRLGSFDTYWSLYGARNEDQDQVLLFKTAISADALYGDVFFPFSALKNALPRDQDLQLNQFFENTVEFEKRLPQLSFGLSEANFKQCAERYTSDLHFSLATNVTAMNSDGLVAYLAARIPFLYSISANKKSISKLTLSQLLLVAQNKDLYTKVVHSVQKKFFREDEADKLPFLFSVDLGNSFVYNVDETLACNQYNNQTVFLLRLLDGGVSANEIPDELREFSVETEELKFEDVTA